MSTGTLAQNSHISRSTASKMEETREVVQSNDNSHAMYSNEAIEMLQMCFSEQELIGGEEEKLEYGDVEGDKVGNREITFSTNAANKSTEAQFRKKISPISTPTPTTPTIFDANKFIEEKQRSGVSIDVLRDDINTYVNTLQAKIERYVNDDLYSSFVHVSGKFVGIPEELQNIHAPIKRLVNEVEGISDTLTRLGNTLQLKLHEADEAETKRFFLAHYTEFLLLYNKLQEMYNVVVSNKSINDNIKQSKSSDTTKANFKNDAAETSQLQNKHDNLVVESELFDHALVQKYTESSEHLNTLQQMMLTIARLRTFRSLLLSCGDEVKELQVQCAEVERYVNSAEEVGLQQFQCAFSQLCIIAFALNNCKSQKNKTELDTNNRSFHLSEQKHLLKEEKMKLHTWTLSTYSQIMESIRELVRVCQVTFGAEVIKDVFRTHVLEPELTKNYFGDQRNNNNASEAFANNSNNKTNLTAHALSILRKIQYDLEFIVFPLVSVITSSETNSVHYTELSFSMFAREVIWPTIVSLLISRLPSLFDIVDVDGFQEKYIAAHALQMMLINNKENFDKSVLFRPMNDMKTNVSNNSELQLESASLTKTEQEWEEKWNVELYATVRTGEMHRRVMSSLEHIGQLANKTNITTRENEDNVVPFMLHCTNVLIEQTEWLFSFRVFLAACTPLFVREVVSCVNQMAQYMLNHYNKSDNNFELLLHSSTSNFVNNDNKIAGSNIKDKINDQNSSDINEISKSNAKQRRLYFALCCIRDLITLDHYLDHKFVQLITSSLLHEIALVTQNQYVKIMEVEQKSTVHSQYTKHNDDNATLPNIYTREVAAITAVISHIRHVCCHEYRFKFENHVLKSVVDDCTVVLQNIKSVRSAYTHTKKPLPTSASWYVSGVVAPIVELIHWCKCCSFDVAEMGNVITVVVDRVMEEFLNIAQETLIIAKRTEESWEKLRRRKEALTANDNSNVVNPINTTTNIIDTTANNKINVNSVQRVTDASASDRDKMIMQLYLDAEAILSALAQVSEYTVPSTHVRERVRNLLRRAEWLQGADMDEPVDVSELE